MSSMKGQIGASGSRQGRRVRMSTTRAPILAISRFVAGRTKAALFANAVFPSPDILRRCYVLGAWGVNRRQGLADAARCHQSDVRKS